MNKRKPTGEILPLWFVKSQLKNKKNVKSLQEINEKSTYRTIKREK